MSHPPRHASTKPHLRLVVCGAQGSERRPSASSWSRRWPLVGWVMALIAAGATVPRLEASSAAKLRAAPLPTGTVALTPSPHRDAYCLPPSPPQAR